MKPSIYDSRLIIFTGLLGFAVAFIDSLFKPYYSYDCWFRCLSVAGKLGVVLMVVALVWLFISTLIKGKF